MKKVILLTVLSLLVTFSYAQTTTAYTLTQAERDMFLNSHNAVRKVYGCTAMTWDPQLEADSAAYAAQCKVNPLAHSNAAGVGENLSTYMASPKPSVWPYKTMDYHVINGWYSEEKNWNCGANTCDTTNGKMCGHLTQIVWCDTYSVGCGIAYCLATIGGKQWNVQNAVCRYKGPGNYIGVHPLKPIGGASKCPVTPTVLGPFTPSPVSPKPAPTTTPTTPTAPRTPTTPTAPRTPTTPAPVKPAPVPVKPAPVPVKPAPVPVPVVAPSTSGIWWSGCTCNSYPEDPVTGQQYLKVAPCQWEPWKDGTGTWCNPNAADYNDWSWPVNFNSNCPDGVAKAFARREEDADSMSQLPMGAWIGIAIAIAVVIIIVIVVIIVVRKKKNDERV